MNIEAQRDISRKLKVFDYAADSGNGAFTYRHFGILRETDVIPKNCSSSKLE